MKNVSAFLKRHSALLLLVLALATVPAGVAFGKYVKTLNVTSGISIDVKVELVPKTYTIDKTKMQTALASLTTQPSSLEFVTGNEVPDGATLCTTDGIQDESSSNFGQIGVYLSADKTTAYIAPMDKNDIEMYAPQDCSNFLDNSKTGLGNSLKSIRCSSLNTSNVTNMKYMFSGCSGLSTLDLSEFDTSKVSNMAYMFSKCSGLKSLNLSSFKTSEVTSMGFMFSNCNGLTSLNVSMFDTSKVTTMQSMFYNCSGLNSLDLSMLDTSNVTTMANMFQGCSGLAYLNVGFNTSKVTIMNAMFRGCSSLTSLDVSSFDTSGVTQMQYMFKECSGLTELDLKNFNTGKAAHMKEMFNGCSGLEKIFAGNDFVVTSVLSSDKGANMFTGCTNLAGGAGTAFSASHVDKTYARIDGGTTNPGYFTGDSTTYSANGSSTASNFGFAN